MGSFSLATRNGRTCLRDADGAPYFALGLNHVGAVSAPGRYNDVFRDQYGGDWERLGEAAYAQLVQWGFNCCGYGAPEAIRRRMPFFACLQVTGNSQWLPRDEFGYDDVFDGAFRTRVDAEAKRLVDEVGRDLNLIGYYWNDMPQWDIRLAREQKGTDWVSFMRSLPEGAPGRARYVEFLRERYGTTDALNAAYGTNASSHEAVCEIDVAALWQCARAVEDDYGFLSLIARELYGVVSASLRNHGGDHLVFGEKYWASDMPDGVLREALPCVDALSVQWGPERSPRGGDGYERAFDRARIDELSARYEKPVMICDHNISFATDEHQVTLWHRAPTRARAADLYREFLLAAVEAPHVVGYCKCQYISRHSAWRDLLKQGMLAEDGSPYEPYGSMIGAANRGAMVRFCMQT